MMKAPKRLFLLMAITVILLVSGISIAGSRPTREPATVDCAGDCRTNRDKMMERCDQMPDGARANCKDRVNKQYDRCIERCNGGSDVRPGR